MISYTMQNAVFDIGLRTVGRVSSCEGLFESLQDAFSKHLIPVLRLHYEIDSSTIEAVCMMVGKQTVSFGPYIHAFLFSNSALSVAVDDEDNVYLADLLTSTSDSGSDSGEGTK